MQPIPGSTPWAEAKANGFKPPLKYVKSVRDRHGRTRHYFRRLGAKAVRLPNSLGSAEFMEAYEAALGGKPILRVRQPRPKLYVIRAEKSTLFKIGISDNPESRVRELQTGSPLPLKLIYAVVVDLVDREREAHCILAAWRKHGEWFDLGEAAGYFTHKIRHGVGADHLFNALDQIFRGAAPALEIDPWDDAISRSLENSTDPPDKEKAAPRGTGRGFDTTEDVSQNQNSPSRPRAQVGGEL